MTLSKNGSTFSGWRNRSTKLSVPSSKSECCNTLSGFPVDMANTWKKFRTSAPLQFYHDGGNGEEDGGNGEEDDDNGGKNDDVKHCLNKIVVHLMTKHFPTWNWHDLSKKYISENAVATFTPLTRTPWLPIINILFFGPKNAAKRSPSSLHSAKPLKLLSYVIESYIKALLAWSNLTDGSFKQAEKISLRTIRLFMPYLI